MKLTRHIWFGVIVILLVAILGCGFVVFGRRVAVAYYSSVINFNPRNARAYCERGCAFADLGRYPEAISDYTRAIEIDPMFAMAYTRRGNAFDKLGRHAEAINDYILASDIDPKFAKAYCNRGVALGNLGRYKNAIEAFTDAIDFDPKFAPAYYNRALAYYNLGKYEKAIADLTRTVELDPKNELAFANRGNAFCKLGKRPEAIADYTRAIEINPKSATVHLDLAELLLCGGNAEACLAELQKVEYPVAPDKDRLILSYLRLLATRALGQDTSSLEAEFAALLGKNIPLAWETDEIEQWLASGNVDPATQAFAIGLNKRLKAKIQK